MRALSCAENANFIHPFKLMARQKQSNYFKQLIRRNTISLKFLQVTSLLVIKLELKLV